MKITVRTLWKKPIFTVPKSDEISAPKPRKSKKWVETKRSNLRNGLTCRQRGFVLEKLLGLNDRDAALAAGYSLSVAQNTKQRIWKPQVRAEWERLRCEIAVNTAAVAENKSISLDKTT
jgi:hypothetical protein